jgi:hypothetical protein
LGNSDLEVISDNAVRAELNQIREGDAHYFLQLYEDIAQERTCITINGTPEFKAAVLKDIATLLTRPGGRQLIGSLYSTLNSSVIIREDTKAGEMKFHGDPNYYVTLNLNEPGISASRDPKNGEVHFVPNPSFMVLAHEFIHVLHDAAREKNPDSLPPPEVLRQPCNRFFKNFNEKLTICGLANTLTLCENTLRAEFGLMPRISHTSSQFLDFTPQDLPDIETPNQSNYTRLESAVFFKAHGEIRKLLKAGANPGTGYALAIYHQDQEMIRFLLQEGASPYQPDRFGTLPLHLAARWNFHEIVQLLMDHGVRIDVKDQKGRTALHVALQKKSFESALRLIEHGAPFTPEALESIPNEPGLREEFVKRVPHHLNFSEVMIIPISSHLPKKRKAPEEDSELETSNSRSKRQRRELRKPLEERVNQ